jgi:glutamate-1-semialdehyde 2,1-aminomutase
VLIFDECTSGFRVTFGSLHKKQNVEPDMALFGKASGNELLWKQLTPALSAASLGLNTLAPAAAHATLKVMAHVKSRETSADTGLKICKEWQNLAGNSLYALYRLHT